MTINSDVRVAGPFTATGVAQVLPFNFRIFNTNDVIVVVTDLDGVDTTLTNQSGFTVSMNADQDVSPGGTVTITSTLSYILTLSTALTNTQPTQVTNGGPFNANVITAAFDRIVVLIQQAANATTRSLKIPISDGNLNTILPNAIARAGKVLGFDGSGNLTVTSTDVDNVVQSGLNAAAAQAAQTAAETAKTAAEAAAAGVRYKASARARTTSALPACTYANGASGVGATLTGNANGALAAQDTITLTVGQDLLVADQVATLQNGLYRLTQVGTAGTPFILTRRTDMDQWSEVNGAAVSIDEGATYADSAWLCSANIGGTMGVTAITWVPFPIFIADNTLNGAKILDASLNAGTKIIDATLTYAKIAAAALASTADIIAGTASKLVSAASLAPLFQGCQVYQTAITAIANNTVTNIGFDTEQYKDSNFAHSNVTNNERITCNFTGRVRILGQVQYASTTAARYEILILKNGADVLQRQNFANGAGVNLILQASAVVEVTSGDYISVQGFQVTGGSVNTNANYTRLSVERIK